MKYEKEGFLPSFFYEKMEKKMKKDYLGKIKSIKNIALNTYEMKISSEEKRIKGM